MPEPKINNPHFSKTWQQQLASAFTSIDALCAYLELDPANLPVSPMAAERFTLKVPLSFAENMEKGNPDDPLLRQVLPTNNELQVYPGFNIDPVGDLAAAIMPGLLHKYHGRVLLINTGTCAINCRYCFRRNFPYSDLQLSKQQEKQVFNHLQSNTEISEVILSGGDPLLLSDDRLANLFQQFSRIPHIKRIRIHSRLPIVLHARITENLISTLQYNKKQIVLVVHSNHANEISTEVAKTCQLLKANGITLFNQAVLLKGINDNVDTLCDLSEKLFAAGVIPYYLHQLDKAKGVGHFEVPDDTAKAIMNEIKIRLPGYLVPKMVKEVTGTKMKQLIA